MRANRPEANLHDREHFIDLKNLTAIGQAGENLLLELMKESSLHGPGMFTKHVLMHLARKMRRKRQETNK